MKTLLSVQSHVAHGYVGGRAATFPLQYLGWDVDNINSVNFSNHTGYGFVKGGPTPPAEFAGLFHGLVDIKCSYDAVISGYIPSADLIDILATNILLLKTNNPSLLYACDPVMGDQGHLYVAADCVDAYRRLLATGVVDIITPNHYELELLCNTTISNEKDLHNAINHIHDIYNVRHVVVSSLADSFVLHSKPDKGSILCAVSSRDGDHGDVSFFKVPMINSYFTGVGDLFTALLVDKFHSQKQLLPAVNQVLTIMADVLKLTHEMGVADYCLHKNIPVPKDASEFLVSKMNDADSMRFFELRVIQARHLYGYEGPGKFDFVT